MFKLLFQRTNNKTTLNNHNWKDILIYIAMEEMSEIASIKDKYLKRKATKSHILMMAVFHRAHTVLLYTF